MLKVRFSYASTTSNCNFKFDAFFCLSGFLIVVQIRSVQGHLVMAAAGLDSEAAFKHRALEVGMQEAYYQHMVSWHLCAVILPDKGTRKSCLMQSLL